MSPADETQSSASVQGASSRGGSDVGCWFLLAAIVVLLLARVPLVAVRAFDNDEFEHAHAAWSVFRGLLPYKDFFEHHTPWYYFLLAPFFRWFAVDQSFESARHFLIFGRLLSLAMTGVSTALVYLVGRLGGASRKLGLLGALFFVAQPVVIHKTMELRPDVPALSFFVGALWCLRRGLLAQGAVPLPLPRLRWFLGGGLALGGAIMCTQKTLFVLPGACVGLGLWTLSGVRRAPRPARPGILASRTSAVLLLLLGVAISSGVTWLGFALRGGGGQFIYNNFVLNAHWRSYSDRHLALVLSTSAPLLLLCLLGCWSALVHPRDDSDGLLLSILGGLIASVVVVPAAYQQFYLPPLTIACLFAARGLLLVVEASRFRARAWFVGCATVPFLIWPVVDLAQALGDRNDVQLARLQFVYAHTRATDPVLDGWLGTNVFRPHPHYYFFMHGELRAMLTPSQQDAYLDVLTGVGTRPALIALDEELRALGPRFLEFVQRNYVSSDDLFYLPVRPSSSASPPPPRLQ